MPKKPRAIPNKLLGKPARESGRPSPNKSSSPNKSKQPSVICGQCGLAYTASPCGPTHAMVQAEIQQGVSVPNNSESAGPTLASTLAATPASSPNNLGPNKSQLAQLSERDRRRYDKLIAEGLGPLEAWLRIQAGVVRAWRPGVVVEKKSRDPSLTDTMRAVVNGHVPPKLRELIALRLGVPLATIDDMSLREVISAMLIFDYVEKGKLDALVNVLDRVDPKSRRVELSGQIDHTLRAMREGITESDAADVYRDMLGAGRVIDVEAEEV